MTSHCSHCNKLITGKVETWVAGVVYHVECATKACPPHVEEEVDPVLNELLSSSVGCPASEPPAGMVPQPCPEHGDPLAKVEHKVVDGVSQGNWKVWECGCEEQL